MINFNVYIGYDEREDIAARVCKHSILSRLSPVIANNVAVKFLRIEEVPDFERPWEPNQSTSFTYTRFMIPYMENYGANNQYSVFCDCDFLFLADITELLFSVDPSKAISVCKHPAYIPRSAIKMDGVVQHQMPRKNWASLIVYNNRHPANRLLTPHMVNTVMPGRKLHTFDWLDDKDIGDIPLDWNVLDDYYYLANPKAIHYTDGGPWFDNYKNTMYSHYWMKEYDAIAGTPKQY